MVTVQRTPRPRFVKKAFVVVATLLGLAGLSSCARSGQKVVVDRAALDERLALSVQNAVSLEFIFNRRPFVIPREDPLFDEMVAVIHTRILKDPTEVERPWSGKGDCIHFARNDGTIVLTLELESTDLYWDNLVFRSYDSVDSTLMYRFMDKAFYYPSGQIKAEGAHRLSTMHGLWTFYYDNGSKRCQGKYEDGVKVGEWTYWDRDGHITEIKQFHASKRH